MLKLKQNDYFFAYIINKDGSDIPKNTHLTLQYFYRDFSINNSTEDNGCVKFLIPIGKFSEFLHQVEEFYKTLPMQSTFLELKIPYLKSSIIFYSYNYKSLDGSFETLTNPVDEDTLNDEWLKFQSEMDAKSA